MQLAVILAKKFHLMRHIHKLYILCEGIFQGEALKLDISLAKEEDVCGPGTGRRAERCAGKPKAMARAGPAASLLPPSGVEYEWSVETTRGWDAAGNETSVLSFTVHPADGPPYAAGCVQCVKPNPLGDAAATEDEHLAPVSALAGIIGPLVTSGATIACSGFMTSYDISVPGEDKVTATATLKFSGEPTFTDGS